MIPVNPGNLLPFYAIGYSANDLRWQRHRLPGQDFYPYGIPAPRTRILPFQISVEISLLSITSFALFNLDGTAITLDTALLETESLSLGGGDFRHWITWKANADLDIIPDCGFWYVFLNLAGAGQYYSEVMHLRDMCGLESYGLSIEPESCSANGTNVQFSLNADVYASSGTTWEIQRFSGSWTTISTGNSVTVVELESTESRQFRIQATSPCGVITTVTYDAEWDEADPCGTLTLTQSSVSVNEAGILGSNPVYCFRFGNTTDKGNVLYQTGYEQRLYLPDVIWDVPVVDRNIERIENGLGNEIKRRTRTVERRGFETGDLPDWILGFLAKAGDLDTVTFEDAKLANSLQSVSFEVSNLEFESPGRQGVALNTGRFYFDVEAETFQGCQEDFEIQE